MELWEGHGQRRQRENMGEEKKRNIYIYIYINKKNEGGCSTSKTRCPASTAFLPGEFWPIQFDRRIIPEGRS